MPGADQVSLKVLASWLEKFHSAEAGSFCAFQAFGDNVIVFVVVPANEREQDC
jgi:hypothetical protein